MKAVALNRGPRILLCLSLHLCFNRPSPLPASVTPEAEVQEGVAFGGGVRPSLERQSASLEILFFEAYDFKTKVCGFFCFCF